MNPLLDKDFLIQLDNHKRKEVFARITSLTLDELPIESIEGKITGGTINIDGASAIRRTCSLSMVSEVSNINQFYWTFNTKFLVEIGLKNEINNLYPEIIWFRQGTFVITNFSVNLQVNNCTISISGKDKGCLLNGEVGGTIPAQTDFGTIETEKPIYKEATLDKDTYKPNIYFVEVDDEVYEEAAGEYDETKTYYVKEQFIQKEKVKIKTIITEMLHSYANEPYHNIIINDLDDYGLDLMEYRNNDSPLYLLYRVDSSMFVQITFEEDFECYLIGRSDEDKEKPTPISELTHYLTRNENFLNTFEADKFTLDSEGGPVYQAAKIEYGDTAGYRLTDLVYAGDLIANVGDSISSVLDKITKMLGNFEYFYDLDGRFIFQKKQTYLTTSWNSIVTTDYDTHVEDAVYVDPIMYHFYNHELFKSFANNPVISNIRNDFSVWGERTAASGVKVPIHYRYAIHNKPTSYKNYEGTTTYDIDNYDWRELLYRMAQDFHKHGQEEDFMATVAANNPQYTYGTTGYEPFYTDILGFWRELYNPESKDSETYYLPIEVEDEEGKTETIPAPDGETGSLLYWNKKLTSNPETLNFWIDFLDSNYDSELAKYSIPNIGHRPKAVNDSKVRAITYQTVPAIIYANYDDNDPNLKAIQEKQGYSFMYLTGSPIDSGNYSGYMGCFVMSAQGKSAKEAVDELLYNHSYCTESISITSIPIYYLEPNRRISIQDEASGINGEYIVSKITFPLTYNGNMSITATKAPERMLGSIY